MVYNWTWRAWTGSHNDHFARNILTYRDGFGSADAAAAREANLFRSNSKPVPWPAYEDVADWAHSEGYSTGDGTSNTPGLAAAIAAAIDAVAERTGLQVHPVDEVTGEPDYDDFELIPPKVQLATIIHAHRLYRRRQSPDGVLGSTAFGGTVRTGRFDPDVEALLSNHLVIGLA